MESKQESNKKTEKIIKLKNIGYIDLTGLNIMHAISNPLKKI